MLEELGEFVRKTDRSFARSRFSFGCLRPQRNAFRALTAVFPAAIAVAAVLSLRPEPAALDRQRARFEINVDPLQSQCFALP
jgi:hypothetical protein